MPSRSVRPASAPAKGLRASLDTGRRQKGNGTVTNACHVIDFNLLKVLYDGNIPPKVKDALAPFLSDFVNVPIKTRAQNVDCNDPTSDLVLDKEIHKAVVSGSPLSDAAFVRLKHKISLFKGLALDKGYPEEELKYVISRLASLTDHRGCPADDKYCVVYKDRKKYNLWRDRPASVTGMKKDGTPDMRTSIGKAKAQEGKTFAQDTGLTKNMTADTRTKWGKEHGIPKTEMRAAETGLRIDGVTPDLRTKLGKQIAMEETLRAERARQQQEEQRRASQRREEEAVQERQRAERQQHQIMQAMMLQQRCVPSMVRTYSAPSLFGRGHSDGFAMSSGFPGMHIGFHASSGSANGRELFMGPRGGMYHISSGGNRVYH